MRTTWLPEALRAYRVQVAGIWNSPEDLAFPWNISTEVRMPGQSGVHSGQSANVLTDALQGAVAGAIGVWVMDQVDWYMYNHEDPQARQRTQDVRPCGLDPAHVLANKVAGAFATELSPPQPHPAGIAIHYSLGIGPGALYGAFHDRAPVLGVGRGALYGLGLFLLQDELANAATGLSARQGQYPWQAHARGLVAHLVYGVVTDSVLRLLKGLSRPAQRRNDQARRFSTRRPATNAQYQRRRSGGEPRRAAARLEAAKTTLLDRPL